MEEKKPRPSAWDIIQNKGRVDIEPDKRILPVKERLESLQDEESQYKTVRERLEDMQTTQKTQPKPLDESFLPERQPQKPAIITPETNMQRKMEKAISKIQGIKGKMTDSANYLSHYYDLKKSEQEFVKLIEEAHMELMEFPDDFKQKLEKEVNKLRTHPK